MKDKIKSMTFVVNDYPADGHLMMVFVQQLVHVIVNMGVKVTVVAPQSIIHAMVRGKKLLPKHSQGITEKGVKYDIYRPYILSFGNRHFFSYIVSWFNKHSIVSILKKTYSNILYAHFWSNAIPIYEYALKNNYPIFVACGEGDNALEDLTNTMSDKMYKGLLSAVKGVISVSTENKRKCIKYGLVLKRNIEVYPNCVNTSIFHKFDVTNLKKQLGINKDDFVIIFVGGFIPRKGPDRVAKAIEKLNDSRIKVLFIGKAFSGYAYKFNCKGIIHKGPVNHDLLPQYLNCADVFVLPTQKEGCCNAIVEALAVGLPIISSDGAFNDDILDDRNSIRVNPNDVDAIANAIKRLKEDSILCKQMSEYSLSRHEEYSIVGRAKKILDFINRKMI